MVVVKSSYQSQHVSCELDGRIRDDILVEGGKRELRLWYEREGFARWVRDRDEDGKEEQRRSSRSMQPTRMRSAVAIL